MPHALPPRSFRCVPERERPPRAGEPFWRGGRCSFCPGVRSAPRLQAGPACAQGSAPAPRPPQPIHAGLPRRAAGKDAGRSVETGGIRVRPRRSRPAAGTRSAARQAARASQQPEAEAELVPRSLRGDIISLPAWFPPLSLIGRYLSNVQRSRGESPDRLLLSAARPGKGTPRRSSKALIQKENHNVPDDPPGL